MLTLPKLARSFVAGDDGRTKRREVRKTHNKTSPREQWMSKNSKMEVSEHQARHGWVKYCGQGSGSMRDTNRIMMIALPQNI
jgi:hypothetical protein